MRWTMNLRKNRKKAMEKSSQRTKSISFLKNSIGASKTTQFLRYNPTLTFRVFNLTLLNIDGGCVSDLHRL